MEGILDSKILSLPVFCLQGEGEYTGGGEIAICLIERPDGGKECDGVVIGFPGCFQEFSHDSLSSVLLVGRSPNDVACWMFLPLFMIMQGECMQCTDQLVVLSSDKDVLIGDSRCKKVLQEGWLFIEYDEPELLEFLVVTGFCTFYDHDCFVTRYFSTKRSGL